MHKVIPITFFALLLSACSALGSFSNCDQATFVDHVILDVPVEDGTIVMAGTHFTKTWEVQNSGSCAWSSAYGLVHSGGDALGAPEEIALPDVAPGATVDISVPMTAPTAPGDYSSQWMFVNADGEQFGVGPDGDQPLEASLAVPQLPPHVVYDFTQVVCLARWDSGRATFLPCEGEDDDQGQTDGYVRVNSDPALENSSHNNPPVIEVKPNNQQDFLDSGLLPAHHHCRGG